MNLYWIAGLALFVLCEKTVPAGHLRGTGSATRPASLCSSGVPGCWRSRFKKGRTGITRPVGSRESSSIVE
ncbi:DUF2182 domain-containing protein [Polaromonas sp. JS666]|uniref:DUF2182 domain-containing protein n=1 Tax=Polaromonas sp. (strain JS666 / ATCC BAA-500) TaxID=296591 RepID=UPI001E384B4D|nr:DUF2182 domain-containing protein [Polaromonas sp. JS666]